MLTIDGQRGVSVSVSVIGLVDRLDNVDLPLPNYFSSNCHTAPQVSQLNSTRPLALSAEGRWLSIKSAPFCCIYMYNKLVPYPHCQSLSGFTETGRLACFEVLTVEGTWDHRLVYSKC